MLHQAAIHATLEVLHLKVATALWDQLVFHYTIRVFLSLGVALVEVVERERTSVRSLCHYNYL